MNFLSEILMRYPRLETERLILRRMTQRDSRDMFEYASLPEVTEYLLWSPHENLPDTKRYLKQVEASYKKGEFHDFGIELKKERKFIGTCGFSNLDMPNSRAEIGYVLNPAYWGRGIAAEAAMEVIRFGFEEMGLNRIEARYMVGNEKSRRVMEKCGMTFEGVQRGLIFARDAFCDIGVCSILSREYARQLTDGVYSQNSLDICKNLQSFKH